MGLAGKSATFMRRAKRSLHHFLVLALAVSTLSAISVVSTPPARALSNSDCAPTVTGFTVGSTVTAVASGNDCIITFTSGTGTWTIPNGISSVAIVVVGGGGGGGGDGGSGGGGGELRTHTAQAVGSEKVASISIGQGGTGGSWFTGTTGGEGTATTITGAFTYTANSGKGGVGWNSSTGGAGGSGGSGGSSSSNGGAGGGGPSDCVGSPAAARIVGSLYFGAAGSNGPSTSVIGSATNYGGGGGGGLGAQTNNAAVSPASNGRGSAGGSGGGGRGSNYRLAAGDSDTQIDGASHGQAGTANTGGGGGGGSACNAFVSSPQSAYDAANGNQQRTAGGAGGSGVVIVKFAVPTLTTPSTPDLDAASDSGVSDTDNTTNDTTPTFSGTGTPGSSIQLQRDGVDTGSPCITNSSGNWSCTTGTLGHSGGGNNYRAVATFFGQTATSGTINVVIRTSGPGTMNVTRRDGASTALTSGQTLTIDLKAGTNVTGFALEDVTVTGGTLSNFTVISGIDFSATFTPTPSSSGTASISVGANTFFDLAGFSNTAGTALSISFNTYGACSPSETNSGGYTTVRFTSTTTCNWSVPSGVTTAEILVVGGGGGGGGAHDNGSAGGGGAGYVYSQASQSMSGTITVSVGAGGSGGTGVTGASAVSNPGNSGGNTTFGSITALGGGGGMGSRTYTVGGSAATLNTAATGGAGGGNAAGTFGFGGGGQSATSVKAGGAGIANSITGISVTYGTGGSGATKDSNSSPAAQSSGTGNGGTGAAANASTGRRGGDGGSGIVIVRYAMPTLTPTFGTPTATTDGFTVEITNFNAGYTWSGTATANGSVAVNGSGLVTVTGVAPGTSSTATITNTTDSYTGASATVSGSSTTGSALTPTFGTPSATADGFTVQINNYSGSYTWAGTATASGTVSVSGTGLVTVTGVAPGTSSTATITTTRTGYTGGSATVSGTSTASSNATLSALGLSSGTLSPTFDSGTTSYTATVANSLSTGFTITPTVTQVSATTVQYLGVTGTTSFTGSLSVGENVIRVVVTAQNGTSTLTYTVTVTRLAAAVSPTIGTQPISMARIVGQSVTFSVSATASDSGALSYQWQKGGVNISEATSSSYTFTISSTSDAGDYRVIVTNSINSTTATTTSSAAKLAVAGTNYHRNFARTTYTDVLSSGNSFTSSSAVIPTSGSFTIEGWFKESVALDNQNPIFSQGTIGTSGFGALVYTSTIRKLWIFAGSSSILPATEIVTGKWYHFALTYDRPASTMKLYLNGTEVGSSLTSYTPTLTGNFFLGNNNYYSSHFFHGQQDQFKIWTSALTSSEVVTSMHAYGDGGITGKILRTLYDFNQSSGSTMVDKLGGFDLSANGSGSSSTWATTAVNVTFDEQGGSTVSDTTFDTYTKIADPGSTTRAGYTLSGWSTTSSGSVISFPYIAPPLSAVTLYAIWSANSNTVTFNANDGSGSPATTTQSITSGTATTLTANAFTRTGYIFTGWDTQANGLGTDYSNQQSVTITSGFTLYAQWTALSTDATLSGLSVSSGTLSPTFSSGTTSYAASVTNATTSITVTPTRNQANATITVNGTAVTSGSASGAISLNVGSNTITVVVTAQDGTTTATYTVTVTRAGSNVATLSALVLSAGTISPSFASGTTSYTASVANSIATGFTVTPTVTQANATTVQYLGSSGTTAFTGALSVGANVIRTVVTAQDGTTTATYTVTVTRATQVFTISFAAGTGGSGTGPTSPTSVNDGATFTTPANTYTRVGYSFGGWSDGTNTYAASATYPSSGTVSANVTLTATWSPINCTITRSTPSGYIIDKLTGPGNCVWSVPTGISAAEVLVVAGGGGGNRGVCAVNYGAGAGGGGVYLGNQSLTPGTAIDILIGSGGAKATGNCNNTSGQNGGASSFGSTQVTGGLAPLYNSFTGGTSGNGKAGGSVTASTNPCASNANRCGAGGGGGASAVGTGLNGGAGVNTSISGVSVTYGGGGPGMSADLTGTAGDLRPTATRTTPDANTGGGGADWTNGADGIVIIKYATVVDYTYDANGGTGTVPAGGSVQGGTAFTTAANPFTRNGYTFSGWYSTANGTGGTAYTENASNTMQVSGSAVVLYAKWIASALVVAYDEQGGESIADGSVNVGASISAAPTAPVRAGYTLSGWSTTSTGSVVSFPYAHGQIANFTLYAIWTVNTLTVTYDSQGGTSVTAGSVATDAKISSAPTPPTKAGYTFSGWATTTTGSVVSFSGGYTHGQTANFTLYAIWAANALTVTYNSKGGSDVSSGTVNTGASISSAPTAPTKAGYTLSGWSATDGGTVVTFPYAHGNTANFTMYAIWSANSLTITYDEQSGSSIADGTVLVGASISNAPTAPTRAGYSLSGWSTTSSGSVVSFPYAHGQTDNFTLYAIWAAISCSPTSTTAGGYTVYTFTTAGTCFWTVPNGVTDVELLAVAGGGGGGYSWDNAGAGGGAGGQVKTGTATLSTTLEVTVGAGGAGGIVTSTRGSTGSSTVVSTITALGGTGGCGARATTCSNSAQATALAAANGGAGGAGGASGKGGGGSNTSGSVTSSITGGAGTATSFTGNSVTYGVGGAGGTARTTGTNIPGPDGSANTGNGGGGASAKSSSGQVNGGAGATGLVVVRVASALTVHFDSQSGSSVSDTSTVTAGIISSAPTDPTRSNYTFLGWFASSTGGSAITFPYTHGRTADFTLYAQWSLNTYAIAFNANNGLGTMANQTVTHGVAVNLNANLYSRANYVFYRWATQANGTGTTYNNLAQVTLTAGTTLYAQWTANTYVVTFNYNGGDGGDSTPTDSFTTGGTAITLPVPTKTGFTFAGWHSDSALITPIGSNSGSGTYSPTGATLTLNAYAKWTAVDYTFTYNSNSAGSGSVPTESSKQITQTVTVKANTGSLVRSGYTFGGWNTQSNGGGTTYLSGSLFTVGSSNVTLYAKWNANTYTVTYNVNGGSGNAKRSTTVVTSDSYTTGGTSVTLPDVGTLTRSGYTFGGWNTSAAGDGTNRLAAATYTTVSDVILYAKWEPVTYTITYDANSGTGSAPTSGGYTTGQASPYSVQSNTFNKASHVFGGWNTADNGTGTSYSPGSSITTLANIVLYAVWIPQFTLHYAINGGTVTSGSLPTDALLTQNTQVTVFSSVGRTGYTFDGWVNGSTTIAPGGSFNIVQDSVLTAKWTAVNYQVSYSSDGGTTPPSSFTKQIGQSYTIGNAPTKPGHDFLGWKTGSTIVGTGATIVMGASDVSYTAQWAAQIYTISYDWNGGRGTAVSDVNYTYGSTAITLPVVGDRVKDGYTFAGWSESTNGSLLSATYIPSESRTLYALWNLGNFTITYNLSGGTLANTSVSVQNGSATTLPLPTRANFVFNGWHTATTGGSSLGSNGALFTPSASQTVYARWIQASLYGITDSLTRIGSVTTVDNVGNTFSGANSNSSVAVSVPANALPAGTTINFDMVGNSNRARGLLPDVNYLISIAISWIAGDGTVPNTASGKPISVTISNATIKAGATAYAIVNNVSTLLGTASQDGTITIELTSDPEVVVAAVKPTAPTNVAATSNGNQQSIISWSAPTSNGGSAITGYTVTSTPSVTTPAGCSGTTNLSCTFTGLSNGTAYTFTVTATNTVGTSVASTSASGTTASLYAVTFDAKGGTSVSSGNFLTASTVAEPTAPTRSGYSFAGWAATDGGSAEVFPYAPGVTSTITMYARWDALDNAVTFDSKGGSDVTASVFSSGGTVAEPTAPTKSGYTFAGWSATDGGSVVTFPYSPGVVTDITLYAKWSVVSSGGGSSGGGGGSSGSSNNSNSSNSSNSSSSGSSTAPMNNVTVLAPVTVIGDTETKVPSVEVTVPAAGSDSKPVVVKVDSASDKFIAEVKIVDGKLSLTPETGFSGKKTVTVTITENGTDRIIQIPLTVLPEVVAKPVLTPTSASKTIIRWTASPNADAYTVYLYGKKVCSTSATSCSVARVLGPDANVQIISNGGDRTISEKVEAEFKQTTPVAITRIVSATITKATLTKVDTKALDKVVGLIKTQGFGTVVISQITTTKKTQALAEARIAAIKKYIDAKSGSEEITFEVVAPASRTYFNNIALKG